MTCKQSPGRTELKLDLSSETQVEVVPSDLLLPENMILFAEFLKNRKGEWRDLVLYLVNRYSARVLRAADRTKNLRFRYQEEGLRLKRVCYLPYRDLIVRLRMLSFASRISMCALVVLMLKWEKERIVGEKIGVPIRFECVWVLGKGILTISARIRRPIPRVARK